MVKRDERDLAAAFTRAVAQQQAPMALHAAAMQPLTAALPAASGGFALADLGAVVRTHLARLRSDGEACADEAAEVIADNRDKAPTDEPIPVDVLSAGACADQHLPNQVVRGTAAKPHARRARRRVTGGGTTAPALGDVAASEALAASELFDAVPGVSRPAAVDAALGRLPLHPERQQQLDALTAMLSQVDECAAFLATDKAATSAWHQVPAVGSILALDAAAFAGTYESPYVAIDGVVGAMLVRLDGQRATYRASLAVLDVVTEVLWAAKILAKVYRPVAPPVAIIAAVIALASKCLQAMAACTDLAIFALGALRFRDLKNSGDPLQAKALAGLLKKEAGGAIKAARTLGSVAKARAARSAAMQPSYLRVAERVRTVAARLPGARLAARKNPFAWWQRKSARLVESRQRRHDQRRLEAHLQAGGTAASYAQTRDVTVARYERLGAGLATAEHGEAHAVALRQRRIRAHLATDTQESDAALSELAQAAQANRRQRRQLGRRALPTDKRARHELQVQRAQASEARQQLDDEIARIAARPAALAEARANTSVAELTSREASPHPDRQLDQAGQIADRELGRELKAFHGDDAHVETIEAGEMLLAPWHKQRGRPLPSAPASLDELPHRSLDLEPLATEGERAARCDEDLTVAWTPEALATATHAARRLPEARRVIETYIGRHKSLVLEFQDIGQTAAALRALDQARRGLVARNQEKLEASQTVLGEQQHALQAAEPIASAIALQDAAIAQATVGDTSIPEVVGGSWWQRALAFVRRKVRALAQATIGRVEQWLARGVLSLVTGMSKKEFQGVLTGSAHAVAQGQAGALDAAGANADAVAQSEALHGLVHEDEQAAFGQVLESRGAIAHAVPLRATLDDMQQALPGEIAEGASYVEAMRAEIAPGA
ncbi:MAG: hypothetical protein IPL79_03750 [Myxococcales bacterium]|nr:hypothetical protein [Myxococcales bacterium]